MKKKQEIAPEIKGRLHVVIKISGRGETLLPTAVSSARQGDQSGWEFSR
jgi:hypothetical protein